MENLTVEKAAVVQNTTIETAQNLIVDLETKLKTHQARRDEIAADVEAAAATANETREMYLSGSTGERKLTDATQRADTLKSALKSIQARVDAMASELSQARENLQREQLLFDAEILARAAGALQKRQDEVLRAVTLAMEQSARESLRIMKSQFDAQYAFNQLTRGQEKSILNTLKERGTVETGAGISSLNVRDDDRPLAFAGFQVLRNQLQLTENILELQPENILQMQLEN
jgi:predicted  nucleic acid-binding Zn-ribbon protein